MTADQRRLIRLLRDLTMRRQIAEEHRRHGQVHAATRHGQRKEPKEKPGNFDLYGPSSTWTAGQSTGSPRAHEVGVDKRHCPQCEGGECPIHGEYVPTGTYYYRARDLGYDVAALKRRSHPDVPETLHDIHPKTKLSRMSEKNVRTLRRQMTEYPHVSPIPAELTGRALHEEEKRVRSETVD